MTPIVRSPSDWIIYFSATSGYALGPIAWGTGTPYARSCGHFTDWPQLAIGWATKEEAAAVIASLGGSRSKPAKAVLRSRAIAKWQRGWGADAGTVDWGTSSG